MRILGIDPGTSESAYAIWDSDTNAVLAKEYRDNDFIVDAIRHMDADACAVEFIEGRGLRVGQTVFLTAFWAGRFVQAWTERLHDDPPAVRVFRRSVKAYLCGRVNAGDADVRRAVLDRFPATGGGSTPEIGTAKEPGPLYGVRGPDSEDIFAALGVAIFAFQTGLFAGVE